MYDLKISGCDDATHITIELSQSQYELVRFLCEQFNHASTYGCMPRMYVKHSDEQVEYWQ